MLAKLTFALVLLAACGVALADQPGQSGADQPVARPDSKPAGDRAAGEPVPLNKSGTILIDRPGKRLLLKTKVVCRECALEMLLCKSQTKEHESILAIDGQAYVIHTGLLALGARSGAPVQYVRPKPGGEPGEFIDDFRPPTGHRIDIFLQWTDEKGKPRRVKAQDWMRYATRQFFAAPLGTLPDIKLPEDSNLRYDKRHQELSWYGTMSELERQRFLALSNDEAYRKAVRELFEKSQIRPMKADFVFAGSSFYVDEEGQRFYQAESGDVICVANFPTALIDVAVASTASGEDNLLFESWTERIPPLGTEVIVELVPAFKDGKPVIAGGKDEPPAATDETP
ncbi:MAG TPA: YdjY domain-containing protein [Planctomycetaceae bacterium]|nr:YdjY domain-containing protein [Planctomycetaceae bacterium]